MDKNEKFLDGWMGYFFVNLESFELQEFRSNAIFNRLLSVKDNNILLEKIRGLLKNDKRASKHISEGPHPELININNNDLASLLYDVINSIRHKEYDFVEEIVGLLKKTIKKNLKHMNLDCDYSRKLDDLAKLFKLNECEKKLVMFSYLRQIDGMFYTIFDEKEFRRNSELARITNSKQADIILAFRTNGPLKKYLLEDRFLEKLRLNNFVLAFFTDSEDPKDFFYKEYLGESFRLDSFTVNKKELDVLSTIICKTKGGSNILLHGQAGTGKTEIIKSLARHLNKKIYFIKDENASDGVKKRLASIEACESTVDIDKSIIVVDEADSMLNTVASHLINGENVEKGFVNKFLEERKGKIIWIINDAYRIEDSALRRFAFSMHFKRMNKKQRMLMWQNVLEAKGLNNFLDHTEIKDFSEKHEVNTAGIALALNGVEPILQEQNKEELKSKIDIILKNHKELLYGESKKHIRNNSINYSLEGLNMDTDPVYIINVLNSFKANKADGIRNMNLMLSGAPGTGKTEFARHLSRELEIDMVTKTASELISCYVGDTEKNIRYAFNEAREQESMLFIDEADTFLYPRESAQRSWEISHTNEMLYQIESFEGILICATNFYKNLDPASIRRFNIKVNFDYLNNDGKFLFYNKILSGLIKENNNNDESLIRNRLSTIQNLTPGDFKVVYQKNFYMDKSTNDSLLKDLAMESKNKACHTGKKLGFA
jgi:transitional endoplasmic reticulum ATPase